jgi:hypothetical protein
MENNELQQIFFQHIKSKLAPHLSLVDEVADLLDISNDSAYRRIRGEKQISFEEIQKLSDRFKISLDQVLNLKNDSMVFSGNFVESDSYDYSKYLDELYRLVGYITGFSQRELIYFSKDIPVYYYHMFPELAAFKSFAWLKTLFQFSVYKHSKFSMNEIQPDFFERIKKIASAVCKIPCLEILNVENIQITLRQIEYYKDTGLFASKAELEMLYKKLHEMIDHMENIATAGRKFMPDQKPIQSDAPIKMYVSDFVLGDNSIIVTLNEKKMCVALNNVINFMITQDEKFCNYSYNTIQNVISKSILISEVGERERSMFFNMIRQRIESYRQNEIRTLSKLTPYY